MKIGILGSGNIACDLLVKLKKSPDISSISVLGKRNDSPGLHYANEIGVSTSFNGIQEIVNNPNCFDLIFDATNAYDHKTHAAILEKLNIPIINLTPAKLGDFCIPNVNDKILATSNNINLISCSGQLTIPLTIAIKKIIPTIDNFEIVTTIAAACAGYATRINIDQYMNTTEQAICHFLKIKFAKVILNLSPSKPEPNTQVTIYSDITNDKVDLDKVNQSIKATIAAIQCYLPGYGIKLSPKISNRRFMVTIEVIGNGDYLPPFAGCLDAITGTAAWIAQKIITGKSQVSLLC